LRDFSLFALGNATVTLLAQSFLNTQTMASFFSPSADHVSAVWCPHSGAKTRGSFSLTASAAQGSLHTSLLLGDFYKNSQSDIVSLPQLKVRKVKTQISQ
jgi:hypothetical protein